MGDNENNNNNASLRELPSSEHHYYPSAVTQAPSFDPAGPVATATESNAAQVLSIQSAPPTRTGDATATLPQAKDSPADVVTE